VRKLEANYDVRASYLYFPLHPETPVEGRSLDELFGKQQSQLAAMHERLAELMAQEGLTYGERSHTYNSRLAQELALWGDGLGATDRLHDALFRAYFVEGLNLAEVEVLVEAARSSGLDPSEARAVVEERRLSDGVDAHWRTARRLGVTGVPTFVASGFGVVGAQPYEALEGLMARVGVSRKS
jgi:predicted DsbA family dithiol-disulfide isomerase